MKIILLHDSLHCHSTQTSRYTGRLNLHQNYFVNLNLNCLSAKPLLGHHALVKVVGFRMAGFMLSGSGIRVFVHGSVELGWGGGEKYNSMLGDDVGVVGMGCGGLGVVGYIV